MERLCLAADEGVSRRACRSRQGDCELSAAVGSEVPGPRGDRVDWKLERVSSMASQGVDVRRKRPLECLSGAGKGKIKTHKPGELKLKARQALQKKDEC